MIYFTSFYVIVNVYVWFPNNNALAIDRVQMSDQTDARSLVGGYSCRDVPGQFRWEDGVLTTAVKQGHGLLAEDADLAPADVTATLIPLIELRQLHVPSRGVILNAAPEFQLFMTQRVSGASFDLTKSAVVVTLDHLNEGELRTMVETLHPKCKDAAEKMVVCYLGLRERQATSGRTLSLRDLLKWAQRLTVTGMREVITQSVLSPLIWQKKNESNGRLVGKSF